ncbi:uncharacterized protein MCYG_06023 [Microsporum canis CBS 113480]|uniref:Uncharacterized protein n=1 Tax=Arthroderma otae (strain ATCC MYA-4605 / CBS 113480) TaxID=554155 RepID=C5FTK1_ARTOC|nr:uncharacterized protein MCYG_06023 [Microsporum canis CBS 113480]EEQ33204.1 predicted protein [Microsporum canis CBS 113480]
MYIVRTARSPPIELSRLARDPNQRCIQSAQLCVHIGCITALKEKPPHGLAISREQQGNMCRVVWMEKAVISLWRAESNWLVPSSGTVSSRPACCHHLQEMLLQNQQEPEGKKWARRLLSTQWTRWEIACDGYTAARFADLEPFFFSWEAIFSSLFFLGIWSEQR